MKSLLIVTLLALTINQAEARNGRGGNHDGEDHNGVAGCELKVNRTKIFFRAATIGTPVVAENQQYKVSMLFSEGRLFEASLLSKESGDLAKLSNDASGNLMGSLVSDEDTANPTNIVLPVSGREVYGSSASGDTINLEKGLRGSLSKSELKLTTDEAPSVISQLECFY